MRGAPLRFRLSAEALKAGRVVQEVSLPRLMAAWMAYEEGSERAYGFPEETVPMEHSALVEAFQNWRRGPGRHIPIEIPIINLSWNDTHHLLEVVFVDGRHRTATLHRDEKLPTIPVATRPADEALWQRLAPARPRFRAADEHGLILPLAPGRDASPGRIARF